MSGFRKATRKAKKLKLGLIGATGQGKTRTALQVAAELAKAEGASVAFIDTEHGSSELYADDVDCYGNALRFDVLQLTDHRPEAFIDALNLAVRSGYGVVIIDSASHAWFAILEYVDSMPAKDKFSKGWRNATPRWRAFLEAIVAAPVHLIVCMRAKMQYEVVKDDKGRSTPQKVGVGAEMRAGAEYEFDLIGEFQDVGVMRITKTRNVALADAIYRRPGADLARQLLDWLNVGASPLDQLHELLGADWDLYERWLDDTNRPHPTACSDDVLWKQLDWLRSERGTATWSSQAAKMRSALPDGGEE